MRLARSRMLGLEEKRSSVRDTVAEWSWVKRERMREVALDEGTRLECVRFDLEQAAHIMIHKQG